MKELVGEEGALTGLLRSGLTAAGLSDSDTVEPISLGSRKQTYLVRSQPERDTAGETAEAGASEGGTEAVVVQTGQDVTALETEAVLLEEIAAETAVPVPTVRASGTVDDGAYLVTDWIEGDNLHYRFTALGRDRQRALARAFGRFLAALHDQFTFEGVGHLSVVDGTLQSTGTADPESWLTTYGTEAIERLPAEFDDIRTDIRAAVETRAPPEPTVSLYPWDYRPGNALVRDGALEAVLDLEQPLAAPPALSVAKAKYLVADWYAEESEPLRDAFRRGYSSVRALPEIRPAHQVAAIASSAVDSRGTVTNPRYPELDREASIEVHREALLSVL